MFTDYIGAVILILFAEMGDKTQFLAMAFATKYPIKKILLGIAIGSFLNHGLAILLGRALLQLIPENIIAIVAGLMFIFFAFNSLKIDDDEIEAGKVKYGAVVTVALAFFIGELGDKTQLTALGLSIDSAYMFPVLLGTVTGMVLTSTLGIFVGLKLGKQIPEDKLKVAAYTIFIFFGVQKIYASFLVQYDMIWSILLVTVLFVISMAVITRFIKKFKFVEETAFTRQAEVLKQTKSKIEFKINGICKGTEHCGVCDGKACLVGYMRYLLTHTDQPITLEESEKISTLKNKIFAKSEARMIINFLIEYYDHYPNEFDQNDQLSMLRKTAEFIVFDHVIDIEEYDKYKTKLQ